MCAISHIERVTLLRWVNFTPRNTFRVRGAFAWRFGSLSFPIFVDFGSAFATERRESLLLIRNRLTRLVIGAGYLGKRVADAWRNVGDRVILTTRSQERAAAWTSEGWETLVLDVTRPDTLANLPPAHTVLYSVGWDRNAGVDRQSVYVDGLGHVLEHLSDVAHQFIYISSTGVYGESQGAWVNEQTQVMPTRDAGRACWEAEQRLMASRWGAKSIRLRFAGIYGPARIPLQRELHQGQPLSVDPSGYLNLIYVDDGVSVVLALERLSAPALYVVSDGTPVLRGEFYQEVARRIGATARFGEPTTAGPRGERMLDNKRIDSAKLHREVRIDWKCPSYREGIALALGVNAG